MKTNLLKTTGTQVFLFLALLIAFPSLNYAQFISIRYNGRVVDSNGQPDSRLNCLEFSGTYEVRFAANCNGCHPACETQSGSIGTKNLGTSFNNLLKWTHWNVACPGFDYRVIFKTSTPNFTKPSDINFNASTGGRSGTVDYKYTGPIPGVVNGVSSASSSVCAGGSTDLTVSGSLNGAAYWQVYTVRCGGTPLTQSASNTITVSPTSNTTYYVRGEGNGLNLKSNCGCKSVTVNVASPAITVSGDATICPGVTTPLTASPSGGTGSCSVSWRQSPAGQNTWTLSGHTGNTFSVTPNASTDYRAVYSCTQGGCTDVTSNIVTVTIGDVITPTINCPGPIYHNSPPGNCGAVATYVITAFDNCQTTLLQTDQSGYTNGSVFPVGSTTLSYSVTDVGGNSATCSFSVNVSDNENPTISCPPNITQNNTTGICGRSVTYSTPSGTDNCTSSTSRTSGIGSGGTFPIGSTVETYKVTDASGNTATCSFNVTINDSESPKITCPTNIVRGNDQGNCSAVVNYTAPSGTDNCPGQTTALFSGLGSGGSFPPGTNTVAYRVTDAAGNVDNCSFTVTINDGEAPQIACPLDVVQSNDNGNCSAVVTYSPPVGTDNCLGQTTALSNGYGSGSSFPIGISVETYTVTDAAGITATCSFKVTVNDTEDPNISCPTNINLSNDPANCSAVVTYFTPQGTDNCTGSATVISGGIGSGGSFPIGTTTESYSVTDASNNSASCSFTITIIDDEIPSLGLLGANPVILCEGEAYVEPGATAADNCDATVGQNIVIDNSQVNSNQAGNYIVTYQVTDAKGNSALPITRLVTVSHTPAQLAPQNCGSCSQIRFDFCEGENTPNLETLLQSNANYEAGVSLNWYADNNGSKGTAISTPIVNTTSKNNNFYWVSQHLDGCEGDARRMRVRVRKTSTVVLDLPSVGCGTGQLDLAAWVSDTRNFATGYIFFDSDPDTGNPSPIGSVTASSGQVNTGQYAVVSLPTSLVTYYAVAANNTGCQVTGSDEVVSGSGASLDPISNVTVHAGDFVQIPITSPDATHILWFNPASFNNPYIGLLGSVGMGNIVFTAANLTSGPVTATLRAVGYNGNCAGQVRDFMITVLPGTSNRQAQNSLHVTAGRVNAHDVLIGWKITYEFKLDRIEVEKQINGEEWEMIDSHDVGSHDHMTLHNGSYLDLSGMGNMTKYRLKLVHADGRAIWSQEVEVNFDFFDSKRFTLYPNPSNGRFTLQAAEPIIGEWRYKLSDQMGRTILIGKLQDQETAFDIRHLPTAHYFLVLTSPEGKQYLERISKWAN